MSKVKPASLEPGTRMGGYKVVRKLSAGGFGVVYLALDAEGQQVAIKEYLAFVAGYACARRAAATGGTRKAIALSAGSEELF